MILCRQAVRDASSDDPFAALAFKTVVDPIHSSGGWFTLRVYSGTYEDGQRWSV